MEIKKLRYFVVLAEELHFGRAASRLAITQPPLSFNINSLEEELGVRLFERTRRSVALSAAGNALLPRAREIIERAEGAKNLVKAVALGRDGRLEIGFTAACIYRGIPELVAGFSQSNPKVEIVMRQESSRDQLDSILRGELDAGFVSALSLPRGLASAPIRNEPFLACLPSNHRLAKRRTINLAELREESFIMLSRNAGPGYLEHITSLCKKAKFTPRSSYAAMQALTVVALVSKGLGVALVPDPLRHCGVANASFVGISNSRPMSNAHLVWNPKRELPGLQSFIEVVQHHFVRRSK